MKDESQQKNRFSDELTAIHERIAELEKTTHERKEADRMLKESTESLMVFMNAIPTPSFIMDVEGRIIMANEALAQNLGKAAQDLAGSIIYDHLPAAKSQNRKDMVEEVIRTGQPASFSDERMGRQFIHHIYPVKSETGVIMKLVVCATEVTNRHTFENYWKRSEFIINSAKELMTLINKDYVYEAVNDAYCKAHERSREEIIGRSISDIWGDEKFQGVIKKYFDECLRGNDIHCEDWFEFAGCGRGYFDVAYYPFRGEGNEVTHVVVTTHDLTDHKLAEDALKQNEEELQAAAYRLGEMNESLKMLAKRREEDKKESETKVLANVREMVLPYLTRLKNTELDKTQLTYIDIIESNLNEIISPLLRTLSSQMLNFTPKEIQVAALIRDGKPTKEIAKLMKVSKGAIDIHRNHIRAKLGLNKKKANLRSYLLSLK